MLISEFITVYCEDIMRMVDEAEAKGLLTKNYDAIIEDDDGNLIKVVYAGQTPINIEDIMCGDIDEFSYLYPGEEALATYHEYRSHYTILEGLDAIMEELFAMQREREKIENNFELYKELLNDTTVSDEEGSELQRRLYSGGW